MKIEPISFDGEPFMKADELRRQIEAMSAAHGLSL